MFRNTKRDMQLVVRRAVEKKSEQEDQLSKGDKAGTSHEFKVKQGRNNRRLELIRESIGMEEGVETPSRRFERF